jgi:hypothetical protein
VLREQGQGDALHGARGDYLDANPISPTEKWCRRVRVDGARTSPRVSGSTCIERKLSR